jgi:hypothetical protein
MNDSVSDFGLGETIKGQNDDSVDINTALDGREYTFPVSAAVATASGMHNRTVGRRVTARILRNKTGDTLAAGDIIVIDIDGGHAGVGIAAAKSSAGDRCCLVVDPSLGASTVADNDLFYGIVRGPSKVRQGATAVALTAGDAIKAGDLGVVADATLSTDHGLILGTTLKASTTPADDGLLVEVELAPEWV